MFEEQDFGKLAFMLRHSRLFKVSDLIVITEKTHECNNQRIKNFDINLDNDLIVATQDKYQFQESRYIKEILHSLSATDHRHCLNPCDVDVLYIDLNENPNYQKIMCNLFNEMHRMSTSGSKQKYLVYY